MHSFLSIFYDFIFSAYADLVLISNYFTRFLDFYLFYLSIKFLSATGFHKNLALQNEISTFYLGQQYRQNMDDSKLTRHRFVVKDRMLRVSVTDQLVISASLARVY